MSLCAVIGNDPVGQYVASRVRGESPGALLIGLEAARPWLEPLAPYAEILTALEFRRFRELLVHHRVDAVIFAGGWSGSVNYWKADTEVLRYIRRVTLWFLHAYFMGVQRMLDHHGIAMRSVLSYFPELGVDTGFRVGGHAGYDPAADLQEAVKYTKRQRWTTIRQTHIVDQGTIIMSESKGTNNLVRSFGKSRHRAGAGSFPVLCKVAAEPFRDIDTPTIGAKTAQLCVENGVRAIVVQAGNAIVMQRAEIEAIARRDSLCVCAH
jgi:DUF1009 family protein